MPLRFEKHITRDMLRAEPETLWVFGDNLLRSGFGGQAAEMRGEPNAVGLPTKRYPRMDDAAFLTDNDFFEVVVAAAADIGRLAQHAKAGKLIVWPSAGIGTGLAMLAGRAPILLEFYERLRAQLARTK